MAKIHSSHIKGNEAVAGFAHKLSEIGVLAERVSNDYGEDLILQTQVDNVADTFTVRVQVKYATLKKNKKGVYTFRFPVAQLWRWVTHADPVLICIYDQSAKRFLITNPKHQFSLWALATSNRDSASIVLSDKDIADNALLEKQIWALRIEYYSSLLARLEHSFLYEPMTKKQERAQSKHIRAEIGILVTSFLRAVKILGEGDEFDPKFRQYVKNSAINLANMEAEDAGLRGAFMMAVLAKVDVVAKTGLPRNLMEHATELSGLYFRNQYAKEWKNLSGRFGRAWHPFGLGRPVPKS